MMYTAAIVQYIYAHRCYNIILLTDKSQPDIFLPQGMFAQDFRPVSAAYVSYSILSNTYYLFTHMYTYGRNKCTFLYFYDSNLSYRYSYLI